MKNFGARLPEGLIRRAKANAAVRGLKIADFLRRAIERELRATAKANANYAPSKS